MTVLTVRGLDDETLTGLKQLGAEHGRSMEAEAGAILAHAVRTCSKSSDETALGSRIHELFAHLDPPGAESPSGNQAAAPFEEP